MAFFADFRNDALAVETIRAALNLAPHPEGGWYRETYRDIPADPAARGAATAILFLLADGETSAWHRVDAAEIWLWHAGAPLELLMGDMASPAVTHLGPLWPEQKLQAVVPAGIWQAARSTGAWTLVSCIVAPAFSFDGFELAG
jgi:predicted cupin superfamily sugar epimerase